MDTGRNWENIVNLGAHNYKCGYASCGREVSSEKGWYHQNNNAHGHDGEIYVCPVCKRPTFFDKQSGTQVPGVPIGNEVRHLPADLEKMWSEIRTSTSNGAYTSAVLTGRKLLMHIAVAQGAGPGLSFVQYVDYLVDNHYAPPNSRQWIDRIRAHGNEANHEIVIKGKDDADEIMTFLEMLMKFIYEFPMRGGAGPLAAAPAQP